MRSYCIHFSLLLSLLIYLESKSQSIANIPISWPSVSSVSINPGGRIIAYIKSDGSNQSLIINDRKLVKEHCINNAWNPKFICNGKYLAFSKKDTLGIINLTTFKIKYYPKVSNYYGSLSSENIAMEIDSAITKLTIENPTSGERHQFQGYKSIEVNENLEILLVFERKLSLIDCHSLKTSTFPLPPEKPFKIFYGQGRILYTALAAPDSSNFVIYHSGEYNKDLPVLFNSKSEIKLEENTKVTDFSISKDFSKILIKYYVERQEKNSAPLKFGNPKVWSYMDTHLLSEYGSSGIPRKKGYYAIINLTSGKYLQLTDPDTGGDVKNKFDDIGEYCIIQTPYNWSEQSWNVKSRPSFYIIDLANGRKTELVKDSLISGLQFSPQGKYVVYFNRSDFNYYSFDLKKLTKHKLSHEFNELLYTDGNGPYGDRMSYGIATWSSDDEMVYIYDKYDIWQFHLSNKQPPLNITGFYGKKTNTILRFINGSNLKPISALPTLKGDYLLSQFNSSTKDDGFMSLKPGHTWRLKNLSSGPMVNFFPASNDEISRGELFYSLDKKVYMFISMSYNRLPNYYLTENFVNFENVSKLDPYKNLTWYKPELHKYKVGKIEGEGIIYKPANFDSTKKYPVIFSIYEKSSDYLNRFLYIAPSDGRLNISYFVNRGYIVVSPNIYYGVGTPGDDALKSVISAFQHLCQFSWIDTSRMGIQGISWGAFETNYIITQTSIFKAACVSAGVSNLISNYNSLRPGLGISSQYHSESGQGRMGASLWENLSGYIKNSPILFADKVKTPVLIEHNRGDEAVSFSQALEWFIALRRLKSKVWLVEYENEGHGLQKSDDQIDFTNKLLEFYDHFLRNKEIPQWMDCHVDQ